MRHVAIIWINIGKTQNSIGFHHHGILALWVNNSVKNGCFVIGMLFSGELCTLREIVSNGLRDCSIKRNEICTELIRYEEIVLWMNEREGKGSTYCIKG